MLTVDSVTITSILRTTSVSNSVRNKKDITFNFITRGIWTLVEANLGIITSCLVALRKPLGMMFPGLFSPSKEMAGFKKAGGELEKGYTLSDLSTGRQDASLWRGSNLAQQSVFISGPKSQTGRRSDEQHIFLDMLRDSDSEPDGKTPPAAKGISKRVEVVRTSIHQDRDYYHTGGYSVPVDGSTTNLCINKM